MTPEFSRQQWAVLFHLAFCGLWHVLDIAVSMKCNVCHCCHLPYSAMKNNLRGTAIPQQTFFTHADSAASLISQFQKSAIDSENPSRFPAPLCPKGCCRADKARDSFFTHLVGTCSERAYRSFSEARRLSSTHLALKATQKIAVSRNRDVHFSLDSLPCSPLYRSWLAQVAISALNLLLWRLVRTG